MYSLFMRLCAIPQGVCQCLLQSWQCIYAAGGGGECGKGFLVTFAVYGLDKLVGREDEIELIQILVVALGGEEIFVYIVKIVLLIIYLTTE